VKNVFPPGPGCIKIEKKQKEGPMKRAASIHIGTSGWHYPHWKGPFYPFDQAEKDFLEYYAGVFQTVEINNTFYHLSKKETFLGWSAAVPDHFIFALKASRYLTHMKKLKDVDKSLSSFLDLAAILKDKMGPILFQLPPRWHQNTERFQSFLKILPKDFRFAFEFRDHSWYDPEIYDLLSEAKAAFCIYDLDGHLSPQKITADFIYVRLHGPEGPYRGRYKTSDLAGWARAFLTWSRKGKEIYCYFDNDEAGFAALNAGELQVMIKN
jgi:uncharacterized protein YecE (DUF72 family)